MPRYLLPRLYGFELMIAPYTSVRLAGAQVTPFGGTFAFPHWPATSYEIPMVYPVVDGRLFIRGALGIYCYDLRQPTEAAR